MKKLLKATLGLAIGFTLLGLAPMSAEAFSGRVTVGSVNGAPGETVGVPVYLGGNDINFNSFRLPLRYNSADLIPDSVSLVGTLTLPGMQPIVSISSDSQFIGLTVIPPFMANPPSISTDSGKLATFWFTVKPGSGAQVIAVDSLYTIDTLFSPQFTLKIRRVEFIHTTDSFAFPVTPQFNSGQIVIMSTAVGDDDGTSLPTVYELNQNYPNPFNPSTTISFSLPRSSDVSLKVYNVLGQTVTTILNQPMSAGRHEINWDASGLPSGVYFYRLATSMGIQTRKMTLVK